MNSKFTIAAIPLKIAWADRDENLKNVENYLRQISRDTDLVVLPELFSSGFIQDPDVLLTMAEPTSGETMTRISQFASRYGVAIAGSFLCKVGNKIYNRGFIVEPNGEESFYDKRHLFSLSSERDVFTPGVALPFSVRYRGWNIAMIVCYDLRFPAWCRNRKTGSMYDIMLVPANWPTSRGFAWRSLLSARAIENQAIYVGANRGGSDDFGEYDDSTFICNALGETVSAEDESSGIVYATVDKEELEHVRTKLPFGNDADDIILCNID